MNVFFCGTGGTGKSTVLEKVASCLNLPVKTSVVRGFYAMKGIDSQKDLDGLPDGVRAEFQLDLLRYYMATVTQYWRDYPKGFIMDRSVYDHAAYAVLTNLSSDWSYLQCITTQITDFNALLKPQIVYFGYPPPWLDQAEDGFRNVRAAHDLAHNALLYNWLSHAEQKFICAPVM